MGSPSIKTHHNAFGSIPSVTTLVEPFRTVFTEVLEADISKYILYSDTVRT